jgi:hypothetical protein
VGSIRKGIKCQADEEEKASKETYPSPNPGLAEMRSKAPDEQRTHIWRKKRSLILPGRLQVLKASSAESITGTGLRSFFQE